MNFSWVIVIGNILLDLIVPILVIVGHIKVGKSIQNVTLAPSEEPTLGDSPFDRAIKQTAPKKSQICSNCGASVLSSAVFCPHCGNSIN
ncbi:MAG: zinc ribbon domain-containing protein [Promethearchaeota archaeon]